MYINTGRHMVWLNMLFWLRPVPVFDGHRTERHQELPHVQVAKSQKIGEQASKSWNILNILLNIHKHLILLNIFDFQRYAAAFFCAISRWRAHPQRRMIPDSIPEGSAGSMRAGCRAQRTSVAQTPKDTEDSLTDDFCWWFVDLLTLS